jgi:hypothetical protein
MNHGRSNPDWATYSDKLVKLSKDFAEACGVRLAAIFIHPQNSVAGFKDEQSSAEGQTASKAWRKLSRETGAVVVVIDHLGKDADAGLRGTSAKETNASFILTTGETKKDAYCERQLEVRKMRNGPSGKAVSFWMEDFEATLDQQVKAEDGTVTSERVRKKTLVIRWGDELLPVGQKRDASSGEDWPRGLGDLREAISEAMLDFGTDHMVTAQGPLVRAVDLERVRPIYYERHVVIRDEAGPQAKDTKKKAFQRGLERAAKARKIIVRDVGDRQLVWFYQKSEEQKNENLLEH